MWNGRLTLSAKSQMKPLFLLTLALSLQYSYFSYAGKANGSGKVLIITHQVIDSNWILQGDTLLHVDFSNSIIRGYFRMVNCVLPDTLNLSGVTISGEEFDLLSNHKPLSGDYCYINLINASVKKLRLDYQKFRLYFPEGTSVNDKCNVYESLLNNFSINGFSDSYETLDIEFSRFKYHEGGGDFLGGIWNSIQKYWWNYGYSRGWIFFWSLLIILLTGLAASFCFGKLLAIYNILDGDYLKINANNRGRVREFVGTFHGKKGLKDWKYWGKFYAYACMYTGSIFFALKIKNERLNYEPDDFEKLEAELKSEEIRDSRQRIALIICIYILFGIGLICCAFMLNFFLVK
jgi:hypothetical protein